MLRVLILIATGMNRCTSAPPLCPLPPTRKRLSTLKSSSANRKLLEGRHLKALRSQQQPLLLHAGCLSGDGGWPRASANHEAQRARPRLCCLHGSKKDAKWWLQGSTLSAGYPACTSELSLSCTTQFSLPVPTAPCYLAACQGYQRPSPWRPAPLPRASAPPHWRPSACAPYRAGAHRWSALPAAVRRRATPTSTAPALPLLGSAPGGWQAQACLVGTARGWACIATCIVVYVIAETTGEDDSLSFAKAKTRCRVTTQQPPSPPLPAHLC